MACSVWYLTPHSTIFQSYRGSGEIKYKNVHVTNIYKFAIELFLSILIMKDRRGRGRMVVGLMITYAISTYHH